MNRTGILVAAALSAVLAAPRSAPTAWVVNEQGQCVDEWSPQSMARGPAAIVNAPLVPFRSAAGGVLEATDKGGSGFMQRAVVPTMLGVVGLGMGVVESVIWVMTGVADTLTGGYFGISSEEATQLSVAPIRPYFSDRPPPETDRCGRSLRAAGR